MFLSIVSIFSPKPFRPGNDPFCQACLMPFCADGKTKDPMPLQEPNDLIEIFALKKPVWQFEYGPLLEYFVSNIFASK